jgi:hypothetical protein
MASVTDDKSPVRLELDSDDVGEDEDISDNDSEDVEDEDGEKKDELEAESLHNHLLREAEANPHRVDISFLRRSQYLDKRDRTGSTILHLISDGWQDGLTELFEAVMDLHPELYLVLDNLDRTVLDRDGSKRRSPFVNFFVGRYPQQTRLLVQKRPKLMSFLLAELRDEKAWAQLLPDLGDWLIMRDAADGNTFLHMTVLHWRQRNGDLLRLIVNETIKTAPRVLEERNDDGKSAYQCLRSRLARLYVSLQKAMNASVTAIETPSPRELGMKTAPSGRSGHYRIDEKVGPSPHLAEQASSYIRPPVISTNPDRKEGTDDRAHRIQRLESAMMKVRPPISTSSGKTKTSRKDKSDDKAQNIQMLEDIADVIRNETYRRVNGRLYGSLFSIGGKGA